MPTVKHWVRRYIEGRIDLKPRSILNLETVEASLVAFMGDRTIDSITKADAKGFRAYLKSEGYAEATIANRVKKSKQFFNAAIDAKLITENPFHGVKIGSMSNSTRHRFITHEEIASVLKVCPDVQWRLIFALARYGGLRIPSDMRQLKWGDIHWDKGFFLVHAEKTEHHENRGVRKVPLFSELQPILMDAFDQAEPGCEYVVTRYRDKDSNMRTHAEGRSCTVG
jgi:integrase